MSGGLTFSFAKLFLISAASSNIERLTGSPKHTFKKTLDLRNPEEKLIGPLDSISVAVPENEGILRHLRLVPAIKKPDGLPFRAPSQKELEAKLHRAANTSPWVDGQEYRHLKAFDPD